MKISDLKQGMKFKPLSEPELHGVCISISEGQFTYRWVSAAGFEDAHLYSMKLKEAIDCFERYGWQVLSDLEKELV